MKLIGDDIGKGQSNKAYITVTWPEYISKVENKAYITGPKIHFKPSHK